MKEDQILLLFGENLRRIRLEKKLSQEALAYLCELDRTYISSIERGKRNLSLINIVRIASALDVSAQRLLESQIRIEA